MARIRTIKPDFWTNSKVASVGPIARLMFIGMWNYADDYGRLAYEPLSLKLRLFANDPGISVADVRDMITDLCTNDLIIIYSANDKEYIEITGWDHQKIDKRQASKLPAPFADGSAIRQPPPTPPDSPRPPPTPASGREGNGMEGRGVEGKEETREVALSSDEPSDFDAFWDEWPNKVGKPAALKAFNAAVKRGAALWDIQDGLRSYIRDKPPDRPWLNPATFLNQNRWEDRPAAVGAPNGQSGKISAASNKLVESLKRGFGGAGSQEHPSSGANPTDARLLSYRGSQ
jgi:hypothetical protein